MGGGVEHLSTMPDDGCDSLIIAHFPNDIPAFEVDFGGILIHVFDVFDRAGELEPVNILESIFVFIFVLFCICLDTYGCCYYCNLEEVA